MPIKTIGDRIIADATAEAKRLRDRAKKTAAQIGADAKEEADRFINDALERSREAGAQKKKQRLAAAGLAARDRVIAAKQTAIDEAFSRAGELIEGMSEDRYVDMLAALMAARADGGEEVIFDGANAAAAKAAVQKANAALKLKERAPVSLSSTTRPIGKGFILSAGKIEESFALNVLLESAREELEAEVAQILFGDDD